MSKNDGDAGAEGQQLLATLERMLAVETAEIKGALDEITHSSRRQAEAPPGTSLSLAQGRRILVVDDEPDLRDAVRVFLELQGYIVLQAADGAEAVAKVRTALPDLVVLDVKMPTMDGPTALREIRACSAVPIIVLSARGDEEDKVRALDLGADDYVTKPFSQRELLARIESALRRAAQARALPQETLAIDEDLTIDFARNRVVLRGAEHTLTATEHRLLYHLVSNAGRLLPFETLLARVWGPEYREEVHYVRLYVSYLRGKIEPDPAHPKYILTEKGLGYRFAELGRERARQQAREEVAGRGPCEVKPPVRALPQYAEAIVQRNGHGGASDEARILHRIEWEVTRMHGLIEELLDLQRLQSGLARLEESPFDLGELAACVAEELQPTTRAHRLRVDAEEPVVVRGDRRRIREVLVNLLENVIEHSLDGGVITVTGRQAPGDGGRGGQAVLAVSDHGSGIAPADLPHVFERSFQASVGRPRQGAPGLDVGLYIARGIVEQHGGRMWAESVDGRGSTFYLALPN